MAYSNLTYRTALVDTTDTTAYTFSAVAIGTAAADRWVIVAFGVTSGDFDSMTIGGIAATISIEGITWGSGSSEAGIGLANVPTGTTADVVVNGSATPLGCHIGVWTVNMASGVATDTGGDHKSGTTSCTVAIDIPANGFAVAVAHKAYVSDDTQGFNESFFQRAETFGSGNAFNAAFGDREVVGAYSGTVTSTWVQSANSLFALASYDGGTAAGQPYDLHEGGVKFVNPHHGGIGHRVFRKAGELLVPERPLIWI